MAGKNEIKHRLSLEGDDEVKAKLKAVGEAGKQSLGDIEKKLGEAHGGLGKLGEPLGELKEALAPFIEGAELGGLGGLLEGGLISRLLGAAGPAAAIAALGGVALHLAKVSEESEKTDKRLKGLGGGAKAFEGLEESAKKLGVDASKLAPGFEDFLTAKREAEATDPHVLINPYMSQENRDKFEGYRDEHPQPQIFTGGRQVAGPVATKKAYFSALEDLVQGSRVDHTDSDAAIKAASELLADVQRQHKTGVRINGEDQTSPGLTGDAVRGLQKVSPAAANRLANVVGPAAGRGFVDATDLAVWADRNRQRMIQPGQVFDALGKDEPNAHKDADAARGVSDAFERLKSSAGQLDKAFGNLAGGPLNKFLKDKVDDVAGGVEKAAELVEHNKDKIIEGAKRGYELGSKTGIAGAGLLGGAIGGGLAAERGIGGDLIKEYGPELKEQIAKQFESGVPEFLKNAVINPGALGPSEVGGASKLTPEALGDTTIPKPLTDSASRKALLVGSPLLGAARFLPELFGLTKGEPPQDAPPPQAQQPITPPSLPPQPGGDHNPAYNWPIAPEPQQPQQPAPGPTLDQLLQQRTAAGPAPEPGIGAAIASALQGFVEKFAPAANNRLEGTDASAGTGIRGDAGPLDNGEAPQNVAALDGAAGAAAEGLQQVASAAPAAASSLSKGDSSATATVSAKDGGFIRSFDDGGAVRGPGTSTSDDIPARLSDGEYVVNARETGRNRGALDAINNGTFAKAMSRMFADGGAADKDDEPKAKETPRLKNGDHEVTYDPSTGGAFVDGVLHLPGDPLLDDPAVKRGMEQSKAGMRDQGSKHERYHSPFVGRFGHDDSNGAEDTYVADGGYLAGAGKVQHFARGGNVWWKKYYPHAWDMLFGSQQPIKEDGTESTMTPQQAAQYNEDASGVVQGRGQPTYRAPDEQQDDEDTNAARGGFLAGLRDVRRYASGSASGPISGPGTTTSDDIPAMLSHGEFVVNARETAKNRDLLHAINDGTLHKALGGMIELPSFADGGGVGDVPGVTSPGLAPSAGDISSSPAETTGHHAIDMRTNFGDFRVLAPERIARSMSAAARDSANAQTGQLPSWYKGR